MLFTLAVVGLVLYLLTQKKYNFSKEKIIHELPASEVDLKNAKFIYPSKSDLPPLHGWIVSVIAKLATSFIGQNFVVPGMFKMVKLNDFRARKLPETPLYMPIAKTDKPMKMGEECEGIVKFYENIIKNSETSEINRLRKSYESGQTNPKKVIETILDIIKTDSTNSIVQHNPEEMRKFAKISDQRLISKTARMLEGMPFVVKENVGVKGYERRGGLPIKHPVIEKDAYIVEKLLEQGAIMVGIANMHQIGMGTSGLNSSPWHNTGSKNPIDLRHHTGGSSSGTGAAVSSGLVPFGIGNDGGGSIRIPSAFCGISGIKCTFGRMSLHGDSSSEAGSTVTHQGPMATCMDDLTFLYGIMAGFCDQANIFAPQPVPRVLSMKLDQPKVGIWSDWNNCATENILRIFCPTLDMLEKTGVVPGYKEVAIPEMDWVRTSHLVTILSEMVTGNRNLITNHDNAICNDTKMYLCGASYLKAMDYILAAKQKERMWRLMERVFDEFDVDFIITPTTGRLPATRKPGDDQHIFIDNDYSMQVMSFAALGNLIGLPAVTVPIGVSTSEDSGVEFPVSLQIYGKWWEEDKVLQLARQIEQSVGKIEYKKEVTYKY